VSIGCVSSYPDHARRTCQVLSGIDVEGIDTGPQPDRSRRDHDEVGVVDLRSRTLTAESRARPPIEEVNEMLHPSDPTFTGPLAVRDGHSAPVTCAACGCRLTQSGEVWFHFNPLGGRDARGCRVGCADAAHDATGRPVSLAV
jgi:hypothetical protein